MRGANWKILLGTFFLSVSVLVCVSTGRCKVCGEPRLGEMSHKDRLIVEFINEVCEDDGTLNALDTEVVLELLQARNSRLAEEILARHKKK